jgi:hypothetical protein
MVTARKLVTPYVIREPINLLKEHGMLALLKEHGMLATIRTNDSWDDTNTDPAKGILYGVLMGSLLWSAILLLVDVLL